MVYIYICLGLLDVWFKKPFDVWWIFSKIISPKGFLETYLKITNEIYSRESDPSVCFLIGQWHRNYSVNCEINNCPLHVGYEISWIVSLLLGSLKLFIGSQKHFIRSVKGCIRSKMSHPILNMVCFEMDNFRIWRASPLSSPGLCFTPNNPYGRGCYDSKTLMEEGVINFGTC